MERSLNLRKDQHLAIEGAEYRVAGGIEFYNSSDGSRWTEYCLRELHSGQVKWLSADNLYEEYALYIQCRDGCGFSEAELSRSGFREADSGKAEVTGCFGSADVHAGDIVRYTEYEDGTEELLMSIEEWDDGTEYSTGYYLDLDEITLLDSGPPGAPGIAVSAPGGKKGGFFTKKRLKVGTAVILIFIFFVAMVSKHDETALRRYLENSPDFTYQTSITSDLNSKEKADVYTCYMTVDKAAKLIIQAAKGKPESVQQSEEGDSVAILTKREYCLIYTSTDGTTTVQASSRAYAYQSTNSPYHSPPHIHSYYRGFYYTNGYLRDRDRYARTASGYENYSGSGVDTNPNDPYRSYSDSVRQGSVKSRTSSGGGISSGK